MKGKGRKEILPHRFGGRFAKRPAYMHCSTSACLPLRSSGEAHATQTCTSTMVRLPETLQSGSSNPFGQLFLEVSTLILMFSKWIFDQ